MNTYDERIVAIFHDTIENTFVTAEDLIHEGFSKEIVDAIIALSRNDGESYMDFIRRCKQNELARKVKIADIEDNMDISMITEPSVEDYERVKKYQKAWKELNVNEN